MKNLLKSQKELRQERYDELIRYAGKIEAIILLIDDLEGIEYGAISEVEYDENVTQASSLLFNTKQIIEKSAKRIKGD